VQTSQPEIFLWKWGIHTSGKISSRASKNMTIYNWCCQVICQAAKDICSPTNILNECRRALWFWKKQVLFWFQSLNQSLIILFFFFFSPWFCHYPSVFWNQALKWFLGYGDPSCTCGHSMYPYSTIAALVFSKVLGWCWLHLLKWKSFQESRFGGAIFCLVLIAPHISLLVSVSPLVKYIPM